MKSKVESISKVQWLFENIEELDKLILNHKLIGNQLMADQYIELREQALFDLAEEFLKIPGFIQVLQSKVEKQEEPREVTVHNYLYQRQRAGIAAAQK